MRARLFASAAAVLLMLCPVLAGQTARPSPAAMTTGLDGIWNFSSLTPLERPADFSGRATMTAAEAESYTKQTLERNNADRRDGSVDADLARAYNDAWYDRGSKVAVVNGEARTSLITDPPDGRLPALTAAAQQRQAARAQLRRDRPADGPEDRSLAERCLLFNAGPPNLPGPYNNYVQILTFPGYVVIFNEMIHDARVVPTDGRAHAPASMRRLLGDSVGKWEGKTLVVDTTNFTDKTSVRGSGPDLHLTERYTRTGADSLLYEFTVSDPGSFTRPWSVALPMSRTDESLYEYACHEGNEAMTGILRGARFGEKSAK